MRARFLLGVVLSLTLAAGLWHGAAPALAQDYDAGMTAFESGDFERAVRIWEPLASSGEPTAQYSLGKIYETGSVDLPRDYGRAVEWYRLAAMQGVAAAQNNLALMYAQGRGVARDAGQAAELWRAAAKQNHAMAQFNLGLAYFRGEGVAENKPEAEAWFRRAADLGLADAQYALGQIKLHGLTAEADRGEALAWYQLAAAQGYTKAKEQAEILRQEGVKPRMEAQIEAPMTPAPAPTQVAAAPAQSPDQSAAQSRAKTTEIVPPAPAQRQAPTPAPAPTVIAKSTAAQQQPQPRAPAAPAMPQAETMADPMVDTASKAMVKVEPPAPAAPQVTAQSTPQAVPQPAPARVQPKTQVAHAAGTAAAVGTAGKVKVWLYSAQDEGEAISYLRRVESRHKGLLAGIDGSVMPVDQRGQGVLYRVVAGNFPSWVAGRDWCKALKSDAPGSFCKVLPTPGGAN